jgi:alkylated DNA repair dioxygenase AlkB
MNASKYALLVFCAVSRPKRIVGEIRRFNGDKWICKEVKMKRGSTYDIALHHGGNIKVYSNLINTLNQIKVEKELRKDPKLFREYPIQGGREPRANLFFHEKATDDEIQLQPGYQYRSTRMKAISYNGFPGLERVAKQTAEHCSVPYWNIGVNAVCYRDGNDSMGYHTDNDQGEDTILSELHAFVLNRLYTRDQSHLPTKKRTHNLANSTCTTLQLA